MSIPTHTRAHREAALARVHGNVALLPSELVARDFQTDSLQHQGRGLNRLGLEEYELDLPAAWACEERLEALFGFPHNLVLSQGRLAEALLARLWVSKGCTIPTNLAFPTTRLHQELQGGRSLECPCPEAFAFDADLPFKGNLDLQRLEDLLKAKSPGVVPYVCVELCVNGAGGQAVSLENLRSARRITQQHGVALVLDATRILENAVQIKERDELRSQLSLWEIVREICAQADALTMSLSKDLPTPIGGLLALRDDAPFQQGLDFLMAMGDGLSRPAKASIHAALRYAQDDPRYIERRVALVRRLHDGLSAKSFPLVRPAGGHAVFIRVGQLVPHLDACEFPGEAINLDWYAQFGIRGATLPLPPQAGHDPAGLLRLALPILGMGEREVDRTVRDLGAWYPQRGRTRGLRATYQPPVAGGAFRAQYERMEEVSA